MSREEVDDVVAGAEQCLRDLCDTRVQITPPSAKQARVRDVLDERVVEDDSRPAFLVELVEQSLVDDATERLADLDLALKGNSKLDSDLELQRTLIEISRAPGRSKTR